MESTESLIHGRMIIKNQDICLTATNNLHKKLRSGVSFSPARPLFLSLYVKMEEPKRTVVICKRDVLTRFWKITLEPGQIYPSEELLIKIMRNRVSACYGKGMYMSFLHFSQAFLVQT